MNTSLSKIANNLPLVPEVAAYVSWRNGFVEARSRRVLAAEDVSSAQYVLGTSKTEAAEPRKVADETGIHLQLLRGKKIDRGHVVFIHLTEDIGPIDG